MQNETAAVAATDCFTRVLIGGTTTRESVYEAPQQPPLWLKARGGVGVGYLRRGEFEHEVEVSTPPDTTFL